MIEFVGLLRFVVVVFIGCLCLQAQTLQCLETEESVHCTTCVPAGAPPNGCTYIFLVTKCAGEPEGNCEKCCWKATLTFIPGGYYGTIDYSKTEIQVGTSAPVGTGSPELSITHTVNATCDRESQKILCVRGTVTFVSVAGDVSVTECYKLVCDLCPLPPV